VSVTGAGRPSCVSAALEGADARWLHGRARGSARALIETDSPRGVLGAALVAEALLGDLPEIGVVVGPGRIPVTWLCGVRAEELWSVDGCGDRGVLSED
jgi:hypothetical protein